MSTNNLPSSSSSSAFFEKLQGKTFLVARAAGFVPGHLCEFYLQKGIKIIGLDNFVTGTKNTIDILSRYKNFEFHETDITNPLPNFAGKPIDAIFSLASPASPIDFAKIPVEIMRVNSEGTLRLLELAREKGARFLEASTSEVYGDPEVHPQVETYNGNVNLLGVRACYDESKRFAEALTMNFHRKYGVETRIVRIFNTYGPRMRPDDGRVIPNFINQAMRGEDITVYGDGSQTRSFCYVTDLVQGIHAVMFSKDPTPFNVGNPDEKTILETARIIIEHLKSSSKIVFHPLPQHDPKMRCPNLAKLQSQTDYQPKIDFLSGLKETVDYFQAVRNS
jgi:dTDP-glucose 4,6-dehydratase